tara:strand:+ start:108 stop:1760 length:1653 start_codon:yes stop_codon:yes gene_type:complete
MARKVIDIIYNLVRKRLAAFNAKASGSGITRIPTDRQIKKSMQDVFQTLKDGGYNVVSAEKVIKNEDDLARILTEIQQKQIAEAAARKKASEGLERILDKMDRGIPLNPSDQISLEGSGFQTTKDAFKGFEPKVIPGGKKPRDKKSKGGIAAAVKKLRKMFGKDIIQKGKALKKNEKRKLQDMFEDFKKRNMAGGGVAHMLGEPREEMAAGGIALRRLLQFLNKGTGRTGSEGLKTMKLDPQLKFFAEKQGFNPDQTKIDYLEQVLKALKADRKMIRGLEPGAPSAVTGKAKDEMELIADKMFKENFLKTTQGGRFEGLSTEAIDQSIMELETIIKNLKTKGRKLNADGGRIGFADGGMSRRTFLKIMAALAAFPVVGKLTKTAKIAKGSTPLVTKTSEMPEHFPKLVEKILKEGTVVDNQFVKKTGNVKTYRHPDRPDMELTIEGEGDRITLDFETDQGMRGGYEFKKGLPDETVPNPPNEFIEGEVKYRMSPEGDYTKDFEEVIDTGTENLDEFVGIKKQKTSKSKVNLPESLDDDLAEGGLAGLLGE